MTTSPPTEAVALKPCPFCGSNDTHLSIFEGAWFGFCVACGAESTHVKQDATREIARASAARQWNRRAPEPAVEPTECRYCGNQKAPDGTTAHRASCAGLESVSITRLRLDWLRSHPESVAYEFSETKTGDV